MFKVVRFLVALCLFANIALADPTGFQNEANSTRYSTAGTGGPIAMDSKGKALVSVSDSTSGESQSVIPISNATNLNGVGVDLVGNSLGTTDTAETASTATVIVATANAARAGDSILFTAGTAGNIGVWSKVLSKATDSITLTNALPATPANGDAFIIYRPVPLSRPEDSAFATTDPLMMAGAVNNRTLGIAFNSTAGDTLPIGAGDAGNIYTTLVNDSSIGATNTPILREDIAFPEGGATVVISGIAKDAIAQTVSGTLDVAPPALDLGNRQVVTNAPAGETFAECSATVTDTTTTNIKAAVASNRIYVTALTCTNNSAVTSLVDIFDGSTLLVRGILGANTIGNSGWSTTFPIPLRGSVATNFRFAMLTTATSSRCCISGYISTI